MPDDPQTAQGLDAGFIHRPDELGTASRSSREEMDAALIDLQQNKDQWLAIDLQERIILLDQIGEDLRSVADPWISLSIQAKGTQGNAYAEAEEWAMLATVFRNVRLLGKSFRAIRDHGRPRIPGPVTTRPDGQVVAQVFPQSWSDRLMLPGTEAEVWMQPGVTIDDVHSSQAWFHTGKGNQGKVALVLGAGNASMLVPTDFLYKLFVEGQVVLLKLNPVNDYLAPVLRTAFQGLIENGYLRIVFGGADEGSYLCHHPAVDEIHTTGSDKTYERIVFGSGQEGAERKAAGRPIMHKRFTGELGNVTPVIVLPGPWTRDDIRLQGAKLVNWLVINAGFNCLTPRVIIQWADWNQRTALNDAIANTLSKVETRKAYYPRARQRMEMFLAAHPQAQQFGSAPDDHLPWTFITGIDPGHAGDICFRNEAFCGLFAETALEADNVEEFVGRAVDFANETLWGNLTATIIAHPTALRDRETAIAIESAVQNLRYGMVLINQFAALGFFCMTTTWGAYPGNDIHDIQSGTGVTSNVLMFAHPQKSVVRSPFRLARDPFALSSRTIRETGKGMADMQYRPAVRKVPGLIWSALRS